MALSDNFFTMCHFLIFVFEKIKKNENRLCPLPYEEVLEDIIKTVWAEQCGNLKEMRYLAGEKIRHFYPLASRASGTKNQLALMIF